MSTSSGISVKIGDNQVLHVYNHCDGYLLGAGKSLIDWYNSIERARALVENGNISLLRENIHPDPDLPHNWFDFDYKQQQYVCRFYGRDRGEEDNEAENLEHVDLVPNYEHNYYFNGKEWLYRGENQKKWSKLATVLKNIMS